MTNKMPLIAWAAVPLTLGLAFAQTQSAQNQTAQAQRVQPVQPGQTQQTQPGLPGQQPGAQQGGPRTRSGTNYADVFLEKLAAQLGITVDKLKAAAVAAGSATIDQGVQAGDFPSDRAAEMKGRLNENPFAFGGHGPDGHGGHGMHGRGGPGGMRGERGMSHDHGDRAPGNQGQGGMQDDTNAQGEAENSSFTF